jgi:hypothetical protein
VVAVGADRSLWPPGGTGGVEEGGVVIRTHLLVRWRGALVEGRQQVLPPPHVPGGLPGPADRSLADFERLAGRGEALVSSDRVGGTDVLVIVGFLQLLRD